MNLKHPGTKLQKAVLVLKTKPLVFGAAYLALAFFGCAPAGDPNSLVATDGSEVETLLGDVPKANHHIVAFDWSHSQVPGRTNGMLATVLEEEGYTVEPNELGNDALLAVLRGRAGTVILGQPARDYTDLELRALETFVFWGGRLVVFLDERQPSGPSQGGQEQLMERFGLRVSAIDIDSEVHPDALWSSSDFSVKVNMGQDAGLLPVIEEPRHLVFTRPLRLEVTDARTDTLEYTELMTVRGAEDESIPVGFQVNHKLTANLATPDSDIDSPSPYKGKIFVVGNEFFASDQNDTGRTLQSNVSCMPNGVGALKAINGGILTAENCFGALGLLGGPREGRTDFSCNDLQRPTFTINHPISLTINPSQALSEQMPDLVVRACDPMGVTKITAKFRDSDTTITVLDASSTGTPDSRRDVGYESVNSTSGLRDQLTQLLETFGTRNRTFFYAVEVQDGRGNISRQPFVVLIRGTTPQARSGRFLMRSDLPGGSVQGVEFAGRLVPYPNQSTFNGGEDGPPPLALRTFIGPSYGDNGDIPQGDCVCKGQGGVDGPCSSPGSLNMATTLNSRSGGVANVFQIEGFTSTQAVLASADWPRTAKLSWKWEGFLETLQQAPDVDLQPENSFCTGGGNVEVRQYRNLNAVRFLLQFNDVTILTAPMPDLRLFLDHGGNNSCNDDTMCGESVQPVSNFSIAEGLSGTNRLLAETLLEEIGNQGFQIQAFIFDRIERAPGIFPIFLGADAPWVENGQGFHAMELVPVP